MTSDIEISGIQVSAFKVAAVLACVPDHTATNYEALWLAHNAAQCASYLADQIKIRTENNHPPVDQDTRKLHQELRTRVRGIGDVSSVARQEKTVSGLFAAESMGLAVLEGVRPHFYRTPTGGLDSV